MCGIAGIYTNNPDKTASFDVLEDMLSFIQHRGPDESGIFRDLNCGLVNARLSIIDIEGGQQPISDRTERYWIVFNGEIFNYKELRADLIRSGVNFRTLTDTEVVLHLYIKHGPDFLHMINGQFAIAIWDTMDKSLFLARDRFGIRPLFIFSQNDVFSFASEIKAFFALKDWQPELNPTGIRDVFTYWSPQSGNTLLENVTEVPPAHYLIVRQGKKQLSRYWQMNFSEKDDLRTEEDLQDEFENLLVEAARIRLRADVPVGAYLSGGLDSSTITAIIQNFTDTPVETFSIRFSTDRYDESRYQQTLHQFLDINHHEIECKPADIGKIFPDVIWHTETPILRTSPAPMMMLSGLVNQSKLKVVLTGEGADEIFAGYDIFKEDAIRRFVSRDPSSSSRPLLFSALYPEIPQLKQNDSFFKAFFLRDIEHTDAPFYTHHLRWTNTSRTLRFLDNDPQEMTSPYRYPIELPEEFFKWSPLAKTQYLEIITFMSPYLLSSQGDRMAMANAVEGRYPFLDVNLVEFANRLPDHLKLRGLQEKRIVRKFAKKMLPKEIWQRRKRPYRAPIKESFFPENQKLEYIEELLSPTVLQKSGIFKEKAVSMLMNKAKKMDQLSEIEEMALVGIISTQLFHWQFIEKNFKKPANTPQKAVKLIDRIESKFSI